MRARSASGHRTGTVRFRGEVREGSGELWAGVEWDEDGQGRHDHGVLHDGKVVVFQGRGRQRCSFVREGKLRLGRGLGSVLRERDHHHHHHGVEGGVLANSRDVRHLEVVCVEDGDVSGVDPEGDRDVLAGVRELNVARCLVPSWAAVEDMGRVMPRLEELVISRNVLEAHPDRNALSFSFPMVVAFPRLRVLVCDRVRGLDLGLITPEAFPVLETVYVRSNELGDEQLASWLALWETRRLVELDISDNSLRDFAGLVRMLPQGLARLNVAHNGALSLLPTPSSSDEQERSARAHHLTALNVVGTPLCDSVDGLREVFPGVRDLRLKRQAATLQEEALERFHVIARYPSVRVLNGSEVSPVERKDAERHFVRVAEETGQGKAHVLFSALLEKHGSQFSASRPARPASIVVAVDLVLPTVTHQRKLPVSATRADVLRVVQRLHRGASFEQVRVVVPGDDNAGWTEWSVADRRVLGDFSGEVAALVVKLH